MGLLIYLEISDESSPGGILFEVKGMSFLDGESRRVAIT